MNHLPEKEIEKAFQRGYKCGRQEILVQIEDEMERQYEPSTILEGLIADIKIGDMVRNKYD